MSTPSSPSSQEPDTSVRWGLIAGNGQFPFLVLDAARNQGIDMAVIAIREEASPELKKSRTVCTGSAWESFRARSNYCTGKALTAP
jgi:hypothetical protein